MRSFFERLLPTLGRKITLAVIATSLLCGGLFVFFAQRSGISILRHDAEEKALGIASLMKGFIGISMLTGEHEQVHHALMVIASAPYVSNAYLLRRDGGVVLGANHERTAGNLPLAEFRDIPGHQGAKSLSVTERDSLFEYIIAPIVKSEACYRCHQEPDPVQGYFGMKISMEKVISNASAHRTSNILTTVLTFGGLAWVIVFMLSFLVVRPIRRLHTHILGIQQETTQLEQGEQTVFPLLHELKRTDEIAKLCADFNSLITRLNTANAKLHEMHDLQLEQADRLAATGEIAASMAHEIKNPVAGVLGALEVIDDEISHGHPKKEIVAEMMVQLERVNNAVNDLLAYARPAPPVFRETNLVEILQKTATMLSRQAEQKRIAVTLDIPPGLAVVFGDPKQLQQVFWNMMLNAIQAIEKSGNVSISVTTLPNDVSIRIVDSGPGIPPDQLGRIFKPFFTTKHKGTGLGMTIAKRIVEQHKGLLEVTSEVGKGTTVTISIPKNADT